jgi:hypothetical protein
MLHDLTVSELREFLADKNGDLKVKLVFCGRFWGLTRSDARTNTEKDQRGEYEVHGYNVVLQDENLVLSKPGILIINAGKY